MRPIRGLIIKATSVRQIEEDEELWGHLLPLPWGHLHNCPGSLDQKKREEKKPYHKRSRGETGMGRTETPPGQWGWERNFCGQILNEVILSSFLH